MSEDQKDFLEGIKRLNIEARYQEVKDAVARGLNRENTAEILEITKQMHAWILQSLMEKLASQYTSRLIQYKAFCPSSLPWN